MGINYKENNQWEKVKVKVGDNIPVGAEFDYDGQTVPVGYEEVENKGEIYSTTEQRIGTWIDGKPIYRKVIHVDNHTATRNEDFLIDSNISNYETITKIYGTLYVSSYLQYLPLPFVHHDNYEINLVYHVDTNKILIHFGQSFNNASISNINIIVEYTKTTD